MYLLDSGAITELRRGRSADAGLRAWAQTVPTAGLYLSVVAVQELELEVLHGERRGAARGAVLRDWLDRQVLPAFAGRILPVSLEIARRGAGLVASRQGSVNESLTVATALEHGLVLVTRNGEALQDTGVQLLQPFVD